MWYMNKTTQRIQKVTSKGQMTLPASWRNRVNTDTVVVTTRGDVLEISVPAIEELRGRVARISGDGTISLPFVGKIQAAGLTEEQLKQKLVERLEQYMYNPRVVLFVKEYRSRQVAVLGAVPLFLHGAECADLRAVPINAG